MASPAFVAGDFKIFDVKGFKPRMTEIRARVRPKLDAFGESLTPKVGPVLRRVKHLAWFKNEHDEEPAAPLADLTPEKLGELADELTRTRDGQFVVGRAVPADEAARWTEAQYRSAALETFRALAPLYRLR